MTATDDIAAVRVFADDNHYDREGYEEPSYNDTVAALDRLAALLAATEAERDNATARGMEWLELAAKDTARAEAAEKERDEALQANAAEFMRGFNNCMEQRAEDLDQSRKILLSGAREAALRDALQEIAGDSLVVPSVREIARAALAASSPEGER